MDKPVTGSGLYASLIGRRTTAGDYLAKVQVLSTGVVRAFLSRATASGAETTIATLAEVPGLRFAAGEELNVRLQVTGTGPTTARTKVWKTGAAEPSAWQLTATDNTAGLGTPGGVGVEGYLSSAASNAPVTLTVDRFRVTTVP